MVDVPITLGTWKMQITLEGIWLYIIAILLLLIFIFWIWQVISVIYSKKNPTEKGLWLILLILPGTNLLAALVWFITRRMEKRKKRRGK